MNANRKPHSNAAFLANAVLLTDLPPELLIPHNLRDVIYTCGGTRGYTIYEKANLAVVRMANRAGAGLLFGSFPAAVKGCHAYTNAKSIKSYTNPDTGKLTMSLIPLEKVADPVFVSRIQNVMAQIQNNQNTAAASNNTSKETTTGNPTPLLASVTTGPDTAATHNTANLAATEMKKLNVEKLKAAAGGGQYDEEEDPLNAPEVLEAVARFKKQLEERDAEIKKQRKDVVDRRLVDAVKAARARRKKQREEEKLKAAFPPPPSDLPPVPPSADTDAKPQDLMIQSAVNGNNVNVRDSSKRGVSNLPAWMTSGKTGATSNTTDTAQQQQTQQQESNADEEVAGQKRKFVPSEANRDGTERRQKIELADGSVSMAAIRAANQAEDAAAQTQTDTTESSTSAISSEEVFALSVNWEAVEATEGLTESLRVWVTQKIIEYLGEEETTMIDFVLHQVSKRCAPQDMLEELTMVLDEDAEGFVVALWQKLLKASA
mmetsp:Transcript_22997/g.35463  ORF Transcript_22997/g.35463 Transcript_22997/m.35463 type:complete len:489 (-) Transcript_22997:100-1566(-)|eukprot:CAMPEP_0196823384 /NCGR_PEP_ID=MMETSP1362-20130617/87203_1 /TAXON_ID=163516 /ORGANISM="Leptocylindrus danicus, Strain CCMP1856" /LENGTH=488 /DNA_ID=CAMNT_0042203225 /DNA_START=23 /DNA_END=1489 /DNA_ORIENTATION=+